MKPDYDSFVSIIQAVSVLVIASLVFLFKCTISQRQLPLRRRPTVHVLSGFVCSGKSTLSKKLAHEYNAVVFSPDTWLMALEGFDFSVEQFESKGDAVKQLIWRNAQEMVVRYGCDVILDFSFWGKDDRMTWVRRILDDSLRWTCDKNDLTPDEQELPGSSSALRQAHDAMLGSHGYCASYCTARVRVQVYALDTPMDTCRSRLIVRNKHVRDAWARAAAQTEPPATAYVHERDMGDSNNLLVPLEAFDRWAPLLQLPQADEFPIVVRGGEVVGVVSDKRDL